MIPGRYEPSVRHALAGVRGIHLESGHQRFYPRGELAKGVLGSVVDGAGLGGIEEAYDAVLRGVPGSQVAARDNRGREIPGQSLVVDAPVPGGDVILTVDLELQEIAQEALSAAIERTGAKGGFDCTKPFGKGDSVEFTVPHPPKLPERPRQTLEAALAAGPASGSRRGGRASCKVASTSTLVYSSSTRNRDTWSRIARFSISSLLVSVQLSVFRSWRLAQSARIAMNVISEAITIRTMGRARRTGPANRAASAPARTRAGVPADRRASPAASPRRGRAAWP